MPSKVKSTVPTPSGAIVMTPSDAFGVVNDIARPSTAKVPDVDCIFGDAFARTNDPDEFMYGIVDVPVPAGYPWSVSAFNAYATVAICTLGVASVSAPIVAPNQIAAFSEKTVAAISVPQFEPSSVEKIPS